MNVITVFYSIFKSLRIQITLLVVIMYIVWDNFTLNLRQIKAVHLYQVIQLYINLSKNNKNGGSGTCPDMRNKITEMGTAKIKNFA